MDTTATAGATTGAPEKLTVLYDDTCAVCRRARDWLLTQPCLVQVEIIPARSDEARRRFGELPWAGRELVVGDERGRLWIGPAAFITCLWATVRYRGWAYRLSTPRLAPLAERFFMFISKRRDRWSAWIGRDDPGCSWCQQVAFWEWTEPTR